MNVKTFGGQHYSPPLSARQEGFHDIVLRVARKGCGAVLLDHVENLVPEQVCLLLKRLAHVNKRAGDRAACRGVPA